MLRGAAATDRAAPLTISETRDRQRAHRVDRLKFVVDLRVGFSHRRSTSRDLFRIFRYIRQFGVDRADSEALQRRLARAIRNVDASRPCIFRERIHCLDPHRIAPTIAERSRVIAVPVRLAIRALKVEAEQQNPRGTPQSGETYRLVPAVVASM